MTDRTDDMFVFAVALAALIAVIGFAYPTGGGAG